MKYVITEKETGTQHIFTTFLEVLHYIDKWYGDDETSIELKYKTFMEHHKQEIVDFGETVDLGSQE
jgi:hypothetical protein